VEAFTFPPPPNTHAAEWPGTPIGASNTITRTKTRTAVHDKTIDRIEGRRDELVSAAVEHIVRHAGREPLALHDLVPSTQRRARVDELLRLVGLASDVMQRYPHQFSGGQRQRICIARALALAPDLLVADEAVSALDVSVQAQVLKLLEDIRVVTGIAVLFITHDLRVAAQICDDVAVMQHGRIVEQGPAAQVLTHPQQAYTRQLLDAAPGREWDFANFRPVAAAMIASPAT